MKNQRRAAYYQDNPALQEARAAWNQKNYRQSLKLFEKAAKRDSWNLMALQNAAYAFGQHFEIAIAAKYIRRMESLVGNDPGALHLISGAWRDAYRPKESQLSLLKAVETGKARPETYLNLAAMSEKRHQLEEAMEWLDRFLYLKPNEPEGLRLQALLWSRQGDTEKAQKGYASLSNYGGASAQMVLARGLNEWAHLLDQQGDYEGAFVKMEESKTILNHGEDVNRLLSLGEKEMSDVDAFLDSLTPMHLEQWMPGSDQGKPKNVVLTGCPRSGTTLIEKVLDAHSGVISAEELSVFSSYITPKLFNESHENRLDVDHLSELSDGVLRREAKNYVRYMEAAMNEKVNGRILMDKIPSNTMAVPYMLRILPNTHVLYALRDPRDILLSCYFCWMEMNLVSVQFYDLADTVKRVSSELHWWMKIRSVLPPERWCETRYEDTVLGVDTEAEKILHWLGLPWEDGIQDYRAHLRQRGVSSPTYRAVNKPVYQGAVGRWRNYEKQLAPHLDKLESCVNALGYS